MSEFFLCVRILTFVSEFVSENFSSYLSKFGSKFSLVFIFLICVICVKTERVKVEKIINVNFPSIYQYVLPRLSKKNNLYFWLTQMTQMTQMLKLSANFNLAPQYINLEETFSDTGFDTDIFLTQINFITLINGHR